MRLAKHRQVHEIWKVWWGYGSHFMSFYCCCWLASSWGIGSPGRTVVDLCPHVQLLTSWQQEAEGRAHVWRCGSVSGNGCCDLFLIPALQLTGCSWIHQSLCPLPDSQASWLWQKWKLPKWADSVVLLWKLLWKAQPALPVVQRFYEFLIPFLIKNSESSLCLLQLNPVW